MILSAFFLSGAAALGLELIWLRLLGLVFGSESVGVLGVLAGFFGGLTIGAYVAHGKLGRARAPILVYAASELVIAVYALASPLLFIETGGWLPRLISPVIGDNNSLLALAIDTTLGGLLLMPATTCMGVTMPAVIEAWRRMRTTAANHQTVGLLYAVNTLGATVGIAATTYWLLPAMGVRLAAAVLASSSLAAALLAFGWYVSVRGVSFHSAASARPGKAQGAARQDADRAILLLLTFTGVAGVGLEVVGTYVLAELFQNTVFTFANILAVYLVGTALGGWLYTRQAFRWISAGRDAANGVLLGALGISTVLSGYVFGYMPYLVQRLAPAGAGHAHQIAAELSAAVLVLLLPTTCMGATFSHLLSFFTEPGVGRAYALNTCGAALAPFLFGLLLIPRLGPTTAFYCVAALYGGLFIFDHIAHRRRERRMAVVLMAAAGIVALTAPSLVLVRFPPGFVVVAQTAGAHGVVSVTEPVGTANAARLRVLQVNQHFIMGGAEGFIEKRMGHLPLLFHKRPSRVLYLGVGTGTTAGAAVETGIEQITAVELVPEIVRLLPWFAGQNAELYLDSHVRLRISDARRFLRATQSTYDVIVADLYHPSRDGAGFLYTREHFLAARSRLAAGGLFVQWLALHQLSPRDLQTIVRTFVDVFPDAHGMLANYTGDAAAFGLFGWRDGQPSVPVRLMRERLAPSTAPGRIFDGLPDVLGAYMADADGLRRFAGAGPLNTDLTQRILFDAAANPDVQSDPRRRWRAFASVFPYRRSLPNGLVVDSSAAEMAGLRREVDPFATAVTHFLKGEVLRLGSDDGGGEEQAIDEYLAAYSASPGFGEGQLIEQCLGRPQSAYEIISRMAAIRPDRADLGALEKRLDGVRDDSEVRMILLEFWRGEPQRSGSAQ